MRSVTFSLRKSEFDASAGTIIRWGDLIPGDTAASMHSQADVDTREYPYE